MRLNMRNLCKSCLGIIILVYLFGCSAVRHDYTSKKYSPRSELPKIIKNEHSEAYLKGYGRIGSIVVDGTKETALKEAAKKGADLVMLGTTKDVKKSSSWGLQSTQRYQTYNVKTYKRYDDFKEVELIKVTMFRYKPERANLEGFSDCFSIMHSSDFVKPFLCSSFTVKEYIDKGIDVKKFDKDVMDPKWPFYSFTPLYRLSFHLGMGGSTRDMANEWQRENILEVAKTLINAGADSNIKPSGKVPSYYREWGTEGHAYPSLLSQVDRLFQKRIIMEKRLKNLAITIANAEMGLKLLTKPQSGIFNIMKTNVIQVKPKQPNEGF